MNINTNITYRQDGDYNVQYFSLSPEESNIKLGKWVMFYKDYLLNHQKVTFTTILDKGKLWQQCSDIDPQD